MKNFLKMLYAGISWGCLIFVIYEIIFFSLGGEFEKFITHNFLAQAVGSMAIGIGFCVPALVYRSKNLPMGLKVLIHMGIGLFVYFTVAFSLKWIDIKYGTIIAVIEIIAAVAFAFAVWLCFFFYNEKQAKLINEKIKEKQGL